MTTMIEQVARAIYAKEGNTMRDPGQDFRPMTLDDEPEDARAIYFEYARAAIEAMRKPTPKMLSAAGKALSPGRRPTEEWISVNAKHGVRYRAMIDAALEEDKWLSLARIIQSQPTTTLSASAGEGIPIRPWQRSSECTQNCLTLTSAGSGSHPIK